MKIYPKRKRMSIGLCVAGTYQDNAMEKQGWQFETRRENGAWGMGNSEGTRINNQQSSVNGMITNPQSPYPIPCVRLISSSRFH